MLAHLAPASASSQRALSSCSMQVQSSPQSRRKHLHCPANTCLAGYMQVQQVQGAGHASNGLTSCAHAMCWCRGLCWCNTLLRCPVSARCTAAGDASGKLGALLPSKTLKPKPIPYRTTGLSTRPAMAEGRLPSMPEMTITTSAARTAGRFCTMRASPLSMPRSCERPQLQLAQALCTAE